ncbi:hypothetical protein N7536_012100 [Penicillium majusculum]|nr:hypothetical protein N7536_012100 [Penicillium majusculum]
MGGWEIYCAICGGTFSSEVDMDPEGTDKDYYRYEVLRDCNLEWLDKVCVLGINDEAHGNDKYVTIAYPQHYKGQVYVSRVDDPNLPWRDDDDDIPMTAYHDFSEIGLPCVFPFHAICYHDILRRCLRQESPERIKKAVLFDVFENLNGDPYVRLQLNYGEPEPLSEQVWHHPQGQESLVVNPVAIPQLESELDVITKSLSKKAAPSRHSRSEDIFNTLPFELRHEIFKLLPAGSILALKAASLAMHSTALPRDLWKRTLMSEIPWLWEVHDIDAFQSQEVEGNTSKLLLDIQKKSQYTSENDDYIFGLANRRRIWGVCEQIRSRYLEKLKGISNAES